MTEGIILLDKPPGQTSFQSLGSLKKALGTGRVGHAGTLDKFADGLLLVMAGRMTRLCPFATSLDKEYLAVIQFGRGTDTLDPEGTITGEGPVPAREEIESALGAFRGEISQVPPEYSAIHVDGKRASEAARSGQEVRLKPRRVVVQRLDLLDYHPPEASLRISCSKGTYVRSLARDLAAALGTCAHVRQLRRTRIGGFVVENAHRPEAFRVEEHVLPPAAFFSAAPALGRRTVREQWVRAVSQGIHLNEELFERPPFERPPADGIFGAFATDGRLVAVIERAGERLRYLATFPETPEAAAR